MRKAILGYFLKPYISKFIFTNIVYIKNAYLYFGSNRLRVMYICTKVFYLTQHAGLSEYYVKADKNILWHHESNNSQQSNCLWKLDWDWWSRKSSGMS